jgi:hypothetical protein
VPLRGFVPKDIGFDEPLAPILIQSRFEMTRACAIPLFLQERPLFRQNDELDRSQQQIGEFAANHPRLRFGHAHRRGSAKRSWTPRLDFFEEVSRTHPESPDRDSTYLEHIIKLLDAGELQD